jgi:hypothetical protein
MSELKSYTDLHKTIVSFFDELIDMFPKEGDFVALRIMIKDQIPLTSIVKHFRNSILPERENIRNRDVSFFDKNVLFPPHLGEAQSKKFKALFFNLDKENQQAIWKWLDAFVILTEKCS